MANRVDTDERKLIAKYIEPDQHHPSADHARAKGYGMNVWALIGALGGEGGDIESVARAYEVPAEVLEAALAYYREHKDAIDCRLAANLA